MLSHQDHGVVIVAYSDQHTHLSIAEQLTPQL